MVLNPKGGCGKTTLATNLASYYAAVQGKQVVLADFDALQDSTLDWLAARPQDRPRIEGVAVEAGRLNIPQGTDCVIMDAPARTHGKDLTHLVRRVETLIIPVLPSPIDIRAAARFIEEVLTVGRVSRKETRIAVVANRVREYTLVYHTLERFLESLGIPFVATLRDTQNYIRAAEQGLGIFELAPSLVSHDVEQWQPLLQWLASRRSLPVAKKK